MEYKGYVVKQTFNHHVSILKDGKMVMHSPCTKPLSEEELKQMVDAYLVMAKNANIYLEAKKEKDSKEETKYGRI